MSIGKIVRFIFGSKFYLVGELYRKIFVDLDIVLDCLEFSKNPSDKFTLLDIGGGDGAFINLMMDKYVNAEVHLIDIADNIGSFLKPEHRERTKIFNKTSILDYAKQSHPNSVNCILIMDVLHHVGKPHRESFFLELKQLASQNMGVKIIVKDVEPGYFRTWLSYLSDFYVSGDRNVWLISRKQVVEYFERYFTGVKYQETKVFERNKANYAIEFTTS